MGLLRHPTIRVLTELMLICIGLWGASVFQSVFLTAIIGDWPWNLIRGLTFWVAIHFQDFTEERNALRIFVALFCRGMGLNLIVQALVVDAVLLASDLSLMALECVLASILLTLVQCTVYAPSRKKGILLAGDRPLEPELLSRLDGSILGSVGFVQPGVPHLGTWEELEGVAIRNPVQTVIVSSPNEFSILTENLWKLRGAGITVEHRNALLEKRLFRVSLEGLQPANVVLSPALRASSRMMAIQAVYTNLLGLTFLLMLFPVMVLISVCIVMTGGGPILESVRCVGFQKIPFHLFRFRVRRHDGSGAFTMAGRFLAKTHLLNLPQLINVVRGEMALFGPTPVACGFEQRLTELIPFYGYRFSVKPGILGWAQIHEPSEEGIMSELRRLEYDLYYIKEGSPMLDLEILIRTLTGSVRRPTGSLRTKEQSA